MLHVNRNWQYLSAVKKQQIKHAIHNIGDARHGTGCDEQPRSTVQGQKPKQPAEGTSQVVIFHVRRVEERRSKAKPSLAIEYLGKLHPCGISRQRVEVLRRTRCN